MARTKKAPEADSPTPRAATRREREAIERSKASMAERPVRPELRVDYTAHQTVEVQHATDAEDYGALVGEVFASDSVSFRLNAVNALINASRPFQRKVTTDGLNAALAFVAATEPADEVQATIAIQAYATHQMSLSMIEMAKSSDTVPQMVAYGNLANKFGRTFAMQIEALSKLKRGGVQTVKHVHVYQGGQAVVADQVNVQGGRSSNHGGQSYATGTTAAGGALPSPNPLGAPLPSTSDVEWSVQDAWRDQSGRSEG